MARRIASVVLPAFSMRERGEPWLQTNTKIYWKKQRWDILTFICYDIFIYCDNSIFEKKLVYQNVAVRHVAFTSPFYHATQTNSSHGAPTIPFHRAPYPHGHRSPSWIR